MIFHTSTFILYLIIYSEAQVIINEINTGSFTKYEKNDFIELRYPDHCLFVRESTNQSGPSLDDYYIFLVSWREGDGNGKLIMSIDLNNRTFPYDSQLFVIGTPNLSPNHNFSKPAPIIKGSHRHDSFGHKYEFQSHHLANPRRNYDFLPNSGQHIFAIFVVKTQNSTFVQQHMSFSRRHPHPIDITPDHIALLKSAEDMILYGWRRPTKSRNQNVGGKALAIKAAHEFPSFMKNLVFKQKHTLNTSTNKTELLEVMIGDYQVYHQHLEHLYLAETESFSNMSIYLQKLKQCKADFSLQKCGNLHQMSQSFDVSKFTWDTPTPKMENDCRGVQFSVLDELEVNLRVDPEYSIFDSQKKEGTNPWNVWNDRLSTLERFFIAYEMMNMTKSNKVNSCPITYGISQFNLTKNCLTLDEMINKTKKTFSDPLQAKLMIAYLMDFSLRSPVSLITPHSALSFLAGAGVGGVIGGAIGAFVATSLNQFLGSVAGNVLGSMLGSLLSNLIQCIFGGCSSGISGSDFLDNFGDLNEENPENVDEKSDIEYNTTTTKVPPTTPTTTEDGDQCMLPLSDRRRSKRSNDDPFPEGCQCIFQHSKHIHPLTREAVGFCPTFYKKDLQHYAILRNDVGGDGYQRNYLAQKAEDLMKISVQDILPFCSGVENKLDLILARGNATFLSDWELKCETYKAMFENKYVCDYHMKTLVDYFHKLHSNFIWKKDATKNSKKACQFPSAIDSHVAYSQKGPTSAVLSAQPISKDQSQALLVMKNSFLPVGSFVCRKHHEFLNDLLAEWIVHKKNYNIRPNPKPSLAESPDLPSSLRTNNGECNLGSSQEIIRTIGQVITSPDNSFQDEDVEEELSQGVPNTHAKTVELQKALQEVATLAKISNFNFPTIKGFMGLDHKTQMKRVGAVRNMQNLIYNLMASDAADTFQNLVNEHQDLRKWSASKQSASLRSLLQSIANMYSSCSYDMALLRCKHRTLSLCHICTYGELEQYIPGLTHHMFAKGRKYANLYGGGNILPPPQETQGRMRIPPHKINKFVWYISNPMFITNLPFGTIKTKTTSGKEVELANTIRDLKITAMAYQYKQFLEENKLTEVYGMSDSSLYRLLIVCIAKTRKSMLGMDYFQYNGVEAISLLKEKLESMEGYEGITTSWIKDMTNALRDMSNYIKIGLKAHLRDKATVAGHCYQYALSDPNDPAFLSECTDGHEQLCSSCEQIADNLQEIRQVANEDIWSVEEATEARYLITEAITDIEDWIAHQVRASYQERIRNQMIDGLNQNDLYLHLDWQMRFLPISGRESQTQYYGKRGMGVHHAYLLIKNPESNGFLRRGLSHVFDSVTQDGEAVIAIIEHIIMVIKKEQPHIKNIRIRSDNALCYKGSQTIGSINALAIRSGMNIKSWSFSESQDGKGVCDTMSANIKRRVNEFAEENNKVRNKEEFLRAAAYRSGVSGIDLYAGTLIQRDPEEAEDENLSPVKKKNKSIKKIRKPAVPGIVNYHDFDFYPDTDEIHVWRHRGIGNGKQINGAKYWKGREYRSQFSATAKTEDQNWIAIPLDTDSSQNFNLHQQQESEFDDELPSTASKPSTLFECPKEGCSNTYYSFKTLQNHINIGKHNYKTDRLNSKDYALYKYRDMLENQFPKVISTIFTPINKELQNNVCPHERLPLGWAQKRKKQMYRFPEQVRAWLIEMYDNGEKSGRKLNGIDLARRMRKLKKDNGKLVFAPDLWLKPGQIQSFFSRLHKLREIQNLQNNPLVPEQNPQCKAREGDADEDDEHPDTSFYDNGYPIETAEEEVVRLIMSDPIVIDAISTDSDKDQ